MLTINMMTGVTLKTDLKLLLTSEAVPLVRDNALAIPSYIATDTTRVAMEGVDRI